MKQNIIKNKIKKKSQLIHILFIHLLFLRENHHLNNYYI